MSAPRSVTPSETGSILVIALIFIVVVVFIWLGLSGLIVAEHQTAERKHDREQALEIAEAGVDYYRWHLAHNATDYQDGTGQAGPYVHAFRNIIGQQIGSYSLTITAPPVGSTIVEIVSTGWTNSSPDVKRTVKARVGKKSLADYSFLTNSNAWFGTGESTVGKAQANGGIRFDGTANSLLLSPKATYTCGPEHGCNNQQKPGIWGVGGPQNLWQFPPAHPVSAIDFTTVTIDLSAMQQLAKTNGIYRTKCSGQCAGYHVDFHADGTLTVTKVTSTWASSGISVTGAAGDKAIDIKQEQQINGLVNVAIPANGLLFFEDKTWVSGTVNGRATVAAATFPAGLNDKSIIIHNNIRYPARNGNSSLGLIAQKDILIPRFAPANLTIEAALMAQNGSTQRYYFNGNVLGTIETYGSTISNGIWTWSWECGGGVTCSGYNTTKTIFDSYLTYAPPPSFPTTGEYSLLSWQED